MNVSLKTRPFSCVPHAEETGFSWIFFQCVASQTSSYYYHRDAQFKTTRFLWLIFFYINRVRSSSLVVYDMASLLYSISLHQPVRSCIRYKQHKHSLLPQKSEDIFEGFPQTICMNIDLLPRWKAWFPLLLHKIKVYLYTHANTMRSVRNSSFFYFLP